jgi:hypothetical protein
MDYIFCMLKIMAIITVILAVAQAAYPAPQKASDLKADTRQNVAASSTGDSDRATPLRPQKQDSDTSISNANEKDIKDGWDKAGIIANYLLVAVGLAGSKPPMHLPYRLPCKPSMFPLVKSRGPS